MLLGLAAAPLVDMRSPLIGGPPVAVGCDTNGPAVTLVVTAIPGGSMTFHTDRVETTYERAGISFVRTA